MFTVTFAGVVARIAAVALKMTGDSAPTAAVNVLAPAELPTVAAITASPLLSVVDVGADTEPPPVAAAQFTMTPATAIPAEFVTLTLSGVNKEIDGATT
jgi:hypothetical protein